MNRTTAKTQPTARSNSSVTKGSNPKIQKQVPTAWKDRISPQDYEHLRDVFILFDEDGSGVIDPQEIVKILEEIGLDKRNPHVVKIVWAMREANKSLSFEEFVDIVCNQVGEYKTKDGLQRIWKLYDSQDTGVIRFDQLKEVSRSIGQYLDDSAILDLMHSVFINQKTQSNEEFTFDEFYQVISNYYNKNA